MRRVSPRHNKYYFLKIATSPLRDIIPHRARAFAFANLFRGDDGARSPGDRCFSVREQIHDVYRYLYTRELAFHNRFRRLHRRRQCGRAVPIDFALYRHRARLHFLCARSRTPVAFPRLLHSAIYTSGLHFSLMRASIYPDFIFILSLCRHFDRARRYYCRSAVNARNTGINTEVTRDATATDDFITAVRPRRAKRSFSACTVELNRKWTHSSLRGPQVLRCDPQLFDSNNDLERAELSARKGRAHVISSYFFNKFNAILLPGPPP